MTDGQSLMLMIVEMDGSALWMLDAWIYVGCRWSGCRWNVCRMMSSFGSNYFSFAKYKTCNLPRECRIKMEYKEQLCSARFPTTLQNKGFSSR